MDLQLVWTVTELATHADCTTRTVERWLKAVHATLIDADTTFARKLVGTGGWLINSQHPAVVTFIATPHAKGRPSTQPASQKGLIQ